MRKGQLYKPLSNLFLLTCGLVSGSAYCFFDGIIHVQTPQRTATGAVSFTPVYGQNIREIEAGAKVQVGINQIHPGQESVGRANVLDKLENTVLAGIRTMPTAVQGGWANDYEITVRVKALCKKLYEQKIRNPQTPWSEKERHLIGAFLNLEARDSLVNLINHSHDGIGIRFEDLSDILDLVQKYDPALAAQMVAARTRYKASIVLRGLFAERLWESYQAQIAKTNDTSPATISPDGNVILSDGHHGLRGKYELMQLIQKYGGKDRYPDSKFVTNIEIKANYSNPHHILKWGSHLLEICQDRKIYFSPENRNAIILALHDMKPDQELDHGEFDRLKATQEEIRSLRASGSGNLQGLLQSLLEQTEAWHTKLASSYHGLIAMIEQKYSKVISPTIGEIPDDPMRSFIGAVLTQVKDNRLHRANLDNGPLVDYVEFYIAEWLMKNWEFGSPFTPENIQVTKPKEGASNYAQAMRNYLRFLKYAAKFRQIIYGEGPLSDEFALMLAHLADGNKQQSSSTMSVGEIQDLIDYYNPHLEKHNEPRIQVNSHNDFTEHGIRTLQVLKMFYRERVKYREASQQAHESKNNSLCRGATNAAGGTVSFAQVQNTAVQAERVALAADNDGESMLAGTTSGPIVAIAKRLSSLRNPSILGDSMNGSGANVFSPSPTATAGGGASGGSRLSFIESELLRPGTCLNPLMKTPEEVLREALQERHRSTFDLDSAQAAFNKSEPSALGSDSDDERPHLKRTHSFSIRLRKLPFAKVLTEIQDLEKGSVEFQEEWQHEAEEELRQEL